LDDMIDLLRLRDEALINVNPSSDVGVKIESRVIISSILRFVKLNRIAWEHIKDH
jgi:hypothetical protein